MVTNLRFLDVLCGFDIKRQLFHSCRSIGRHPYADNTAWIPWPFTTLIGGKGLPSYFYQVDEGSNYHKAFFIFPHKTMNRQT